MTELYVAGLPWIFSLPHPWIEFDFASALTEKIMAAILHRLAKTVHGEGLKFL
jgi:hypothetical protein